MTAQNSDSASDTTTASEWETLEADLLDLLHMVEGSTTVLSPRTALQRARTMVASLRTRFERQEQELAEWKQAAGAEAELFDTGQEWARTLRAEVERLKQQNAEQVAHGLRLAEQVEGT